MKEKSVLYSSVNVFGTNVLTEDAILYASVWKADNHF